MHIENIVAAAITVLAIPVNAWDVVTTNKNLAGGGTENTALMAWAQKNWGALWWLMKLPILVPFSAAGWALAFCMPYPGEAVNIVVQAIPVFYILQTAYGNQK